MSIQSGNSPFAGGGVQELRGKFEALADKKTPDGIAGPRAQTAGKVKEIARRINENHHKNVEHEAKPLNKRQVSVSPKGTSPKKTQALIKKNGAFRARFKKAAPLPSVTKGYLSAIRPPPSDKQAPATDTALNRLSADLAKLNLESRKQAMGMSALTEKEFSAQLDKTSDQLSNLALHSDSSETAVEEMQSKLESFSLGDPTLNKRIKLRSKCTKGLLETMDKSVIKPTLKETVAAICKESGLNKKAITREARLLGVDNETAMLKMVERLTTYKKGGLDKGQNPSLAKRMKATGYELSVIKGVEKAFKQHVSGKVGVAAFPLDKGMTAIPTKAGILIEEAYLNKGAFKTATLASPFFSIKTPADRKQFISLKPTPQAPQQQKAPSPKETMSTRSDSAVLNEDEYSGSMVINDDEYSGSMVINDDEYSGSMVINDDEYSGSMVINDSDSSSTMVKRDAPNTLFNPFAEKTEPRQLSSIPIKDWSLEEMKQELAKLQATDLKGGNVSELMGRMRDIEKQIPKREKETELRKSHQPMDELEEYQYEIQIAQAMQGPHIIKMHEIVDLESGDKVMIQEAAGYKLASTPGLREQSMTAIDLKQMEEFNHQGLLSSDEQVKMMEMFKEGFQGVERMHQLGYIHRDLKGENILITKDGHGALSDFGTVVRQKNDPLKASYNGTPLYSAPETFKYHGTEMWNNVTEACDVWSCGMMIHTSLVPEGSFATHPAVGDLAANSPALLLELGKNLDSPQNRAAYETNYPEPENKLSLEHLVWSCTRIDPSQRPSMSEVVQRMDQIITDRKN